MELIDKTTVVAIGDWDKISLDVEINPIVTLRLHSVEYNGVMDINYKDIERVRPDCGKTLILYKTGFDDKPLDGFYVQESVEEVKELIEEAKRLYIEALHSYKVIKI